MDTVLGILRGESRRWWYHKELRERGQTKEALRRENENTRGTIKNLRAALRTGGWMTVGRGGTTFYCEPNCRCSGYGGSDCGMVRICRILGIPVIDSTTIPDSKIGQVVRFPMAAHGARSLDSYGSLDDAPLSEVAGMYAALGAKVTGMVYDTADLAKVGRKPKHDAAISAYIGNDPLGMARAISEGID